MRYVSALFVFTLVASPASASVLLEVQADPELRATTYIPLVIDQLESRGEFVLEPDDETAAWNSAIMLAPETQVDAEFIAFHDAIPAGRDQFFENEFEAAIELLAPGLVLVTDAPELLAFHPDLAPGFFDGMLTLVRSYDALGMSETSNDAVARVTQLMWAAEPDEDVYPPGFVQAYRRQQGLMPTRSLDVSWRGEGCRLRVNGFVVSQTSGTDIRLPEGDHFLTLECADRRSQVVRLQSDRAEARFDLDFDSAVSFDRGRAVVRPQNSSPYTLRRIGQQAAHLLREDAAYMVWLVEPSTADATGWLELSRVDSAGEFRAVRIVIGDINTEARLYSAVEYLVTGQTSGGVAVWHPVNGWTEPIGIRVMEQSRSAAPWVFGGLAVAAAATGIIFELRTSESVGDIEDCVDQVPEGCAAESLPQLRSDARMSRSIANTLWITTGTMATAALISAIVAKPPRDQNAAAPRLMLHPLRAGAGATLTWTR
ncbi:MAG: hypothetical protein ACJAYU_000027 [Bradymonadia bacterium]